MRGISHSLTAHLTDASLGVPLACPDHFFSYVVAGDGSIMSRGFRFEKSKLRLSLTGFQSMTLLTTQFELAIDMGQGFVAKRMFRSPILSRVCSSQASDNCEYLSMRYFNLSG